MSRIIIIGGNHAGTAAANTILNAGDQNEVIVIERNDNISFLGCGMALWIGGQISKPDGLFYCDKASLEAKGAKVYMNTEVDQINYDKKLIFATDETGTKLEFDYDKLILATGSLPIMPQFPGAELENVQQVKLFQNAKEVIEKLKNENIHNITIVGAGYIGVELAEAFQRHQKNVTLIDLSSSVLSAYYDENFTCLMDSNLEKHGIKTIFNQSVKEIKGTNKVEKVVTDDYEIDCDMVILCIGFKPNTALGAGKIKLFKNGAFLVNKKQETNLKDVYAIGDCATVYDNSLLANNYIALATNAVRSGIVAGSNAAGISLDHIGVQGSNAISIYGLNMVSTGLTMKKAHQEGIEAECVDYKDVQKATFIETENPETQIRIVYEKGSRRIIGAQMASTYDISMGIHLFSLAIYKQLTIDELKLLDLFFLPHFNQPYNYITMAALGAK